MTANPEPLSSRISVIQPGARLHYAVPQILARHGLLKCLYTDLHADHAWLQLIDRLLPARLQPRAIRRLLGRRLPEGLPPRLVRDLPIETMLRQAADLAGMPRWGTRGMATSLLKTLEKAPLGPGDVVYTVLINEDVEVMQRLKDRGVKIIHECMLAPNSGLLMLEAERRFPGIEPAQDAEEIAEGRRRDKLKYALADLVLVPSNFTRQAVHDLGGAQTPTAVVPYGFDLDKFRRPAEPEAGRILFVGSVGLRKGNPQLAEASRILADRGVRASVRVVGPYRAETIAHPAMQGPQYIGQVPRSQVFEEFRRADVFVLPSHVEGLPIAIIEAMSMGLPVIATPACGDAIRDTIDGFVVDPAEGGAVLADRIAAIVENRALREQMSRNVRERVADYSLDAYAARLTEAVRSV